MLRILLLMMVGAPLSGFMPGRLSGSESPLKAALSQFRGENIEKGYAWTWEKRAVVLTQFPLSRRYHDADIRLSRSPWRSTACVQPENLPEDQGLQRVAREASYFVITQAPDAKECVVNVVLGEEIDPGPKGKLGFLKQLEHAEVIACGDVGARAAKFGATTEVVAQISDVLKHPLPWDPAFDGPDGQRDAGRR